MQTEKKNWNLIFSQDKHIRWWEWKGPVIIWKKLQKKNEHTHLNPKLLIWFSYIDWWQSEISGWDISTAQLCIYGGL